MFVPHTLLRTWINVNQVPGELQSRKKDTPSTPRGWGSKGGGVKL